MLHVGGQRAQMRGEAREQLALVAVGGEVTNDGAFCRVGPQLVGLGHQL